MSLSTATHSRIHLKPGGMTFDVDMNQRELLYNFVTLTGNTWPEPSEASRCHLLY
jgi:hypothetical protein